MSIKVIGVSKVYGENGSRVEALKNINIEIEQGEFVVIVGSSGSGKSTLLNIIGGLDKPTDGKVIIDDKDLSELTSNENALFRRRKIGFVFQFFNLVKVLNVEENIQLPILLDHGKMNREYLEDLITILNLKKRRKHFPNELSGGEQQRTAIGRALAYKPGIILADEPTGNLDRKNSKEVIAFLKAMGKKYNQTVVIITHDIEVAAEAERIITIEDGRIISKE